MSFDLTNATSGNYSQLTNKPSINNVLLSGNKTTADLLLDYMSLNNRPAINGNTLTPSTTGKNIGLVGFSDIELLNLTDDFNFSGHQSQDVVIDFPDDYDIGVNYQVIGVQWINAGIGMAIGGWSFSKGYYPNDPDKWVLTISLYNESSTSALVTVDASLVMLKI